MSNAAATADLGELPVWDLSEFYTGKDDPQIDADLKAALLDAKAFRADYEGKLAGLSGDELAEAIRRVESGSDRMGRIGSYSYLVYAQNMTADGAATFLQSVRERSTDVGAETLFFTLEMNRIEDDVLAAKLDESEALRHYRPWIDVVRAFRPHNLSDELEGYIHESSVTGAASWVRLFDETMAELKFPYRGEELSSAVILNQMSDADPKVREDSAKSVGATLKQNARLFAQITNTLAKTKAIQDTRRNYARPVSPQNLSNQVEDEVVDALVEAVDAAYPQLSHRYYAMKAKWMGKDVLDYWDRNAPLPEQDDRRIPWTDAETMVLDAYEAFDPRLGALGRQFFGTGKIDAPVVPGKAPGAFAHPTTPSAHPYLLVNYQGKTRDVMTLAHELGHGVHQVLAGQHQGPLMCGTPLTLAETASVFGEMLTFRRLLAQTTDPVQKKVLLAGKVEDMLNTVVRQISFHQFETKLHDARREGELSIQGINDIWMSVQSRSLGPSIRFGDDYEYFWAYIPHFIHVPFYVYAYAFGDCLVNSLYAVYQNAEDGFADRYLELLAAGGSKRHTELLAPFGLDARDPSFWQGGLAMISGLIDELEALTS